MHDTDIRVKRAEAKAELRVAHLDTNMRAGRLQSDEGFVWMSPDHLPFHISGLGWYQEEGLLRRLPKHPRWSLRAEVDQLANATAGAQIRFRSDTGTLAVRLRLDGEPNMDQMPATGQCGIDAYVGDGLHQRFWGTARPMLGSREYAATLFHAERELRSVTLNLPLYQGIEDIQIGIEPRARVLEPLPFGNPGRIAIYGTSVTHGGCASRPGQAYPAVLARRLDQEVLNLGFAGNGKGEPEVARILAELNDIACFVLDYETNVLDEEDLRVSLTNFIPILRERHPCTPILVVTRPGFVRGLFQAEYRSETLRRRDLQSAIVDAFRDRGDSNLHFLDLADLDIAEFTVDGVHPTDSGFLLLAGRIEAALLSILRGE